MEDQLRQQIKELKEKNQRLSEAINRALSELETRQQRSDFERFVLRKQIRELAGWETK